MIKIEDSIALLTHKRSPKRRSGAKKLRKLKNSKACSALFETLQKELNDSRTWETQYQMIMALGECGCKDALPFLKELVHREF